MNSCFGDVKQFSPDLAAVPYTYKASSEARESLALKANGRTGHVPHVLGRQELPAWPGLPDLPSIFLSDRDKTRNLRLSRTALWSDQPL